MPDNYKARPTSNPAYIHPPIEAAATGRKTIALVCPGPSLATLQTIDLASHDLVFAVNYAALKVPAEFLTAFYCLDGDLPHIWGDRWPHHLPRVHITTGHAKRLKAQGCANTFPLALADLLYHYVLDDIHLYGVDYHGRAYHTRTPFPPRREGPELRWVQQAIESQSHRITNHGTFDLSSIDSHITTPNT